MNNVSIQTRNLAKLGILAAISIVLVALIHFPVFAAAPFLEYDPADIPIIIGTFALGPAAGLLLTVVAATIQGLTVSAASGGYGILMHIIATGTYVIVAGNIYRTHKSKKTAAIALIAGTAAMTLIMIPANLIITPIFMTVSRDVVKALLLPGIIPFNLLKAGVNSVITFLLYKRVSGVLHR
ncbi:MAG: ECF transporter S component [Bacillota bacterium]|jgi:riboflavin transporter FmnP|nr:ECF transporter S component [Eubacteriales bacterium]MDI9491866.1 ECF transporter S component [Bacillota bacterium]NLV69612.1 ECF transporter S component [Clostridiales bacterium]MDD3537586.1 ECF transporter S component [Eubacteriales bacterium]MDD4285534.1 ECF transporter S component [Eubacteriales bacterium]